MFCKSVISLLFLFFTASASVHPNLFMCHDDTLRVHITYSTSSIFNKPVFGYSKKLESESLEEMCVFGESIEVVDENKEYYVSNSSQTDNNDPVVILKIPKLLLNDYEDLVLFDTLAEIESDKGVRVISLTCEASNVLF